MLGLATDSFHARLACLEWRDEGFVVSEHFEGTIFSGERNGNCLAVKKIFADAGNGEMKGFHRSEAGILSMVEGLTDLVDGALHVEGLLGFVVVLAFYDFFEATDGLLT